MKDLNWYWLVLYFTIHEFLVFLRSDFNLAVITGKIISLCEKRIFTQIFEGLVD